MSGEFVNALELAALPAGAQVRDATGDVWQKVDGKWNCYDARMGSESLIHVWGPIKNTPQEDK